MQAPVIQPSNSHYQTLLRILIATPVCAVLLYLQRYTELGDSTQLLEGERSLRATGELLVAVLLGGASFFGLDRLSRSLLRKISTKPSIELIQGGIRYRYPRNFADVTFSDIVSYNISYEPEYQIELRTKNGQNLELSDYEDMSRLEKHIQEGLSDVASNGT